MGINVNSQSSSTNLAYQGLIYSGFDQMASSHATSQPNVVFANVTSNPKTITLGSGTLSFSLQSMSLGCSNGNSNAAGTGGDGAAAACVIQVSAQVAPAAASTAVVPAATTLPDRSRTVNCNLEGPLVQSSFDNGAWSGLGSVSFSATVGGQPVGVEIDDLVYSITGNCSQ